MAAVVEKAIGSEDQLIHLRPSAAVEAEREYQSDVEKLVDLLSKLNPSAKEFFPSSYAAYGGGGGHRKPDDRLSADAPLFVASTDSNYWLILSNGGSKDLSCTGFVNYQPYCKVFTLILFLDFIFDFISY